MKKKQDVSIGICSEGQTSDRDESKSDDTYTLTVAKTIGSNDTVALLGKVADLMAPSVPHIGGIRGQGAMARRWGRLPRHSLVVVGGKRKRKEQREREGGLRIDRVRFIRFI